MKFQKPFTLLIIFFTITLFSQTSDIYRGEKDKVHDLIHTKLKVDFNFENKELNGEEWLTLKPHFYETSKVTLDAKAMLIHKVSMNNKPLEYNYDNFELIIDLPRAYKRDEQFTIYIKYTARPEKVKQQGSAAITSAKGLYFINPTGLDKNKPTQIWTQGETEASSCWFPTIDAPNQKTSQEIYITVPNKFVTLSNGKLEKQTNNANGTRTDYWNFTQKHAPYLFFMGIGEYEIVKDTYKNIPVDYYVEKKYAPYAKEIFGNTPEMLAFFSKITGIEYPWNKYAQIVGRDYVSGAMENTTAVIHGERAYQVPGQLIDDNVQENTIAHEAFHHWFGDLVTAESWSNLTVNESFANYSEYLWREYKYGKEDADSHLFEDTEAYKNGQNFDKHLVRFNYDDKEDMFDAVSYNKGGAILHMLRKYLGDEAFYAGLNKYLTTNKYGAAEAHQLRLAFEEVTGKDLNWFFNQWYFNSGHPKLEISYDYNKLRKTVTVNIIQNQANEFKFPFAIDIFEGNKRTRHNVFVEGKDASFTFPFVKHPDLIQVNADGVLLCDVVENKVLSDYIHQLKHAENYMHKREALLEVAKKQDDKKAFNAIANAMSDDFYKIRILALENINLINKYSKKRVIDKIMQIAMNDPKTLVQAAAIETLGKLTDPELKSVFEKGLKSKSYSVLGKSLVGMYYIDKALAIQKSKTLPIEVKKIIATPLTRIYLEENDDEELTFIAGNVMSGMFLSQSKKIQKLYKKAFDKIAKSNKTAAIQNLADDIVAKGLQYKQYNFDKVGVNLLRQIAQKQKKEKLSNQEKNIAIVRIAMAKLLE
ncbi:MULTISPECIES: M1 family metallopeptidase [unclassified Tenacibaculum]|uniref:M1 family metallopeptidase n=1 Tax=unclassified Tenacibaculum TaxID=2635139 RepID=UPI001F1B33EF|nr:MULTISPECIES: M1 family metallopeptidase [unclassified Tenacibaculum]MCF2873902.1 M1 family metallopeptidase [Tenacibaculum sp. Cn5-1]MCF2936712.1 M1 family metallopeptidase [Tenacibaculum sp. Cn5-34]MCG7512936.1 M1 family metallopeptidase [Tenacibaculum sp. Cn5-46]